MAMGHRNAFQGARKQAEMEAGRKYGVKPGSMGVNAQAAQKEMDNAHSAESVLQRANNAGTPLVSPGSTDPTGDLYKRASENTMRLQQQFNDQGMADQVRDQFEMQKMADPYQREQDKRNIDRMNAASKYSEQAQKKAGTGVTVNYRQPGSGSRIKGM